MMIGAPWGAQKQELKAEAFPSEEDRKGGSTPVMFGTKYEEEAEDEDAFVISSEDDWKAEEAHEQVAHEKVAHEQVAHGGRGRRRTWETT